MVVQHNLTAMNSNRMLGLTTASQAKSTERLSSGYKINRAADDAAGLSISEKMRKQIRGLTQASQNAQDGISAVQTAEGALTEVHDMLQRMNELAVKAANGKGTNSANDRSYIQNEIDQLVTEIDRVSETTKFNETYLLKGDDTAPLKTNFQYKSAQVTKADYYYVDAQGEVQTVKAGTLVSALDPSTTYFKSAEPGLIGETLSTAHLDSVGVVGTTNVFKKVGDQYVLVDPMEEWSATTSYYSLTFNSDGTVGTAATVAVTSETAWKVKDDKVTDDHGVKIAQGTIIAEDDIEDYRYDVKKGVLDTTNNKVSIGDMDKGSDIVQFVDKDGNEIAANGLYQYLNDDGTLKADGGLFLQAGGKREAATQENVKQLVDYSGKYAVGALTMTLHVGADATTNNQITVDIDAMSAVGLGINGLKVDGADNKNALNAIETLSAAIQRVSTQRSALGAVQNRLEHTINNLDNVVENTTAAESQIRDTDMATEMVKYSNNNILAQAGQAMLAQANQSNQGVLSLLG